MIKKQLEELKKTLKSVTGEDYGTILFAAELVEGMTGIVMWYSLKGENTINQVEPTENIQDEVESIWHRDRLAMPRKVWSGMLIVFSGKDEEIKYFYHDPFKERIFHQVEDWKQQYFPGMEFEPDDDEDNWWD